MVYIYVVVFIVVVLIMIVVVIFVLFRRKIVYGIIWFLEGFFMSNFGFKSIGFLRIVKRRVFDGEEMK